jgi:AcrR family transcriptional regulator
MARWQPDARERLQDAALELYATHGFEETTVAEIAQAAGLTERTFFRYFADKREVIFGGQDLFQRTFTDGITSAPEGATPREIVTSAVNSAGGFFSAERRPHSLLRQGVISAHPELQERELLKMGSLAGAIAAALRERGVTEPAATLAAESGVLVFRVSFEQWLTEGNQRSLVEIERDVFAELGALNAAGS